MSAPHIALLLEDFPSRNSTDRATLLDFARTTPLVYGNWKHFKKLYKLVEAPALSGGETDVELLAALLGRIDAAPIPSGKKAQLKLLSETPKVFNAKTVRAGSTAYSVGGRNGNAHYGREYDYDSSGWRLEISAGEAAKPGGLRGALEAVKAVIAPDTDAAKAESGKRVYDFNAHDYIGNERKVSIQDGVLEINTEVYRSKKKFRVDVSDPAFAFLENSGPHAATWQYMKRRARRLLRKLSTQRPELYRELLHATLYEAFATTKGKPISPENQWVSMDALFATSTRWRQTPAARGPYRLVAPKFHLKAREERAPEIWDAHLDWVRRVFLDEKIVVEANAAALRVLRVGRQEIPSPPAKQLLRFLNSDLPILQTYATRALSTSGDLQNQPPEILAAALLLSGAPIRRKLQQTLDAMLLDVSTPAKWREAFATQLSSALANLGRRARTAASLLARSFSAEVSDKALFAHLALFLEHSGENDQWLFERIRQRGESGDLKFLDEIALLPEQLRGRVLEEFSQSAGASQPGFKAALDLVTKPDEDQNRIGWRFLERTQISPGDLRTLWMRIFGLWNQEIHSAAFSESAAARLWIRAEWQTSAVEELVQKHSWQWIGFLGYCSAEFFNAFLKTVSPVSVAKYVFMALGKLPAAVARQIFEEHRGLARGYAPTGDDLNTAFFAPSYWGAPANVSNTEPAWRFLLESAVAPETLRAGWRGLWSQQAAAPAFGDIGAQVLRRAEVPSEELAEWLKTAPVHVFSPRFFLLIIELAAPAQKVELLLRPSDEQWRGLRSEVLTLLQNDESLRIGFWNGVWQGLESNPALLARFDEGLRATFNTLSIAAFATLLPSASEVHEELAMSWLQSHADELLRDENLETLIVTATHAVDAIRLWGMRRVRKRGLNVAIALRLMESGLPQPFALGREYFESAPRNSADEKDYALALCDSPKREVQNYGREFLLRRASSVLDSALLQNLTEHPDTQMQNWVAEQLLQTSGADTAEFDTTILSTRGKARRAKESVKQRIGASEPSASAPEASALLEMARGTSVRDREWALQQLAKRALNGEEIHGVSVGK